MNVARLVCFDGEPAPEPNPDHPERTPKFSQEDVNKLLANDRRKHDARTAAAERTIAETMESKNLTVREKEALAERLEEIQAANRTAAEQVAHERKQAAEKHGKELTAAQKAAADWKAKYETATIDRALTDAAATVDAYSIKQFAGLLRNRAKLETVETDGGKREEVVIEFDDVDDSGKTFTARRPVSEATKRMKELPNLYGNLFKSGVVSGAGSQSGAGIGPGGTIDVRKLSPSQYMDLRQKNPEALGLRPNKRKQRFA